LIFKKIPFIKAIFQISKFKPDLIITGPLPTTTILYAQFLAKLFKTKLLINASFHQTDPDFSRKPLINILKKANYIWSLTKYEKTFFENELKISSKKIILAGNGIDKNLLIDNSKIKFPKNPNLLFIGSLASHKKIDLLIKSFSTIYKIQPNISLTIAGQKTLFYPQIKKIINTLDPKIKSRIKFCFNFPQNKLIKLIDSSTILILPSTQESFGLVLIEAWSRGKPVITSDIAPLKELVNQTEGGLYFKNNSQKDLEDKILILIKNKNSCQKLGQNGLKYTRNNYTWDKVGEKICQKILY
jgi:glycosyltransferase involved in cell wall biosynthesis